VKTPNQLAASGVIMRNHPRHSLSRRILCSALAACIGAQPLAASAQSTSIPISNVPVGVGASSVVKPNFMFILDDSGSMNWDFMPGDLGTFWNNSVGLYSHRCNTIYYNPNVIYEAPPHPDDPVNRRLTAADGTTPVPRDGFAANGFGSNTDPAMSLDSFQLDNVDDPRWNPSARVAPQRAFYTEWIGAGEPTSNDCKQTIMEHIGTSHTWRKVEVTNRANFAVWYAFYRNRLAVMKSAAARAFAGMDNGLRVGLITIKPMQDLGTGWGPIDPSKYLAIKDFDRDQKRDWIAKLYRMTGQGDTPLREALARVGRHYAGKNDDINASLNDDPVQYSCQRNYALLTTDGYWTETAYRPSYGAGRTIDGTDTIENEDSDPSLPATIRDDFKADFRIRKTSYFFASAVSNPSPAQISACEAALGATRGKLATSGACAPYDNMYILEKVKQESSLTEWKPHGYSQLDWSDFYRNGVTNSEYPVGLPYISNSSTATGESAGCSLISGREVAARDGVPASCSTTDVRSTVPNYGPATVEPWSTPVTLNMNSKRSLADVSMHFYKNNIRSAAVGGEPNNRQSGAVVTTANPSAAALQSETDISEHQRMITYTMGFGVSGHMKYDANYRVQVAASNPRDFHDLRTRTNNKGWLSRIAGDEAKVDDLWHAAVNGRGSYFSAGTADDVIDALETTLSEINGRNSGGAAVGLSNIEPTTASNYVYVPEYYYAKWRGDLVRKRLNIETGTIGDPEGSAATSLALKVKKDCDNRKIWLMKGNTLTDFSWSSFKCDDTGAKGEARADGLSAELKTRFSTATLYPNLRGRDGVVPRPEALVNFLRGQSANERCQREGVFRCRDATTDGKLVLGDIVGSQPIYVKEPFFNYSENNYRTFKAAHTDDRDAAGAMVSRGRSATLYVGANDGMLHAFNAATMEERWAIAPAAMWPRDANEPGFARLASRSYGTNHRFFVDATPTVGDVFDGTAWKSILVGGFNAGGSGYYAIDVTDPESPKALWDFSNANLLASEQHLGLSYGNPIITKREGDNKWVAIVSSGYNSPTGIGTLYVLDALTGERLTTIETGVGSAGDQAGLAKLSAWTEDSLINNTTRYVYGGDIKGNLWRFDIATTATVPVVKLAQLADTSGRAQPITTAPELARHANTRYAFVATGKLLHEVDIGSKNTQSIYSIVDSLSATSSAPTRRAVLSECTLVTTDNTRKSDCRGDASKGWYMDFEESERVVYHPRLQLGTLVFATGLPSEDVCRGGGSTFLHYVDFKNGTALPSAEGGKVGHRTAGGLAGGLALVRLPSGAIRAIVSTMEGVVVSESIPIPTSGGGGKRVTWREIGQ
jgi:type IV pilus assembly protein PilY1